MGLRAVFLFSLMLLSGLAEARSAGKIVVSGYVAYSASVLDGATSSDFYEALGYGGSIGLKGNSWDKFLGYRQSRQKSNYTNVTRPELMDRHIRAGLRWESSRGGRVYPVFELAGDFLFSDSSGRLGQGFGGSTGAGLGLRLAPAAALRLVSEFNMVFYGSESLQRRLFNQRADLVFYF